MKKKYQVPVTAAVLLALFAGAAYMYQKYQENKLSEFARANSELFVRDYSPTHGNPDAKVTIVEFFDPACGTCKAFSPFVKRLVSTHRGKVRVVMRYAPFHKGSEEVVKILEAARKQDRFEKTLATIFEIQSQWASHSGPRLERIFARLQGSGLDMRRIRSEMHDPEIRKRIEQDVADAHTLGVTQTPEFFVNGKPLPEFGYKQLRVLVDSEVSANY